MGEIYDWDIAAANNNSAPPNGAPENMEYEEVNDVMREMMAVVARFVEAGFSAPSSAGTQPAYTLISGQSLGAYANGQVFSLLAHATSTGNVTLNVDGLGAVAVRDARGNQLGSGDIVQNGVYIVVKTSASWRVLGATTAASVRALAAPQAFTTGGTSNAFTVTTGALTAYANGQIVCFTADRANTGAATINIDGLGAEDLLDPDGAALAANDIVTNQTCWAVRVSGAWRCFAGLPINLATQVVGTLAIASGGTGQATAAAAFGALKQDATTSATGVVELATDAEVRSAASGTGGKVMGADQLETAAAPVTLTDAATIAVDWDTFINGVVTLGGNRTLGNPTNGQPGTWRRIQFNQDGTGSRTITWSNQYVHPGGTDAVLSTAASAVDTVYIYCRSTTVFEVHVGGKAWAT